eukprot:7999809-Ditylum_brightwellii.AAC.1
MITELTNENENCPHILTLLDTGSIGKGQYSSTTFPSSSLNSVIQKQWRSRPTWRTMSTVGTTSFLPANLNISLLHPVKQTLPKTDQKPLHQNCNIITANTYEKLNHCDTFWNCNHLTMNDQKQMIELMNNYRDLFDGTLGQVSGKLISLALKPNAKPYCPCPYTIPMAIENIAKDEIKNSVMTMSYVTDNLHPRETHAFPRASLSVWSPSPLCDQRSFLILHNWPMQLLCRSYIILYFKTFSEYYGFELP